jgi:hypothetical protein
MKQRSAALAFLATLLLVFSVPGTAFTQDVADTLPAHGRYAPLTPHLRSDIAPPRHSPDHLESCANAGTGSRVQSCLERAPYFWKTDSLEMTPSSFEKLARLTTGISA